MLAARASSSRDLIFTVLGRLDSGPITELLQYNDALHASLTRLGVPHHLTVVPYFGGSNVCSEQLLPRGSCCGWSSAGRLENASATARLAAKGLTLHRNSMLFVQRWWFLAAATREGYNVMSLDSDLRITTDPLKMVRSASLRSFGLLLSGDFGFPDVFFVLLVALGEFVLVVTVCIQHYQGKVLIASMVLVYQSDGLCIGTQFHVLKHFFWQIS